MLTIWNPPPTQASLVVGEIHIWRFALDIPEAEIEHRLQYLSEDERARAERFVFRNSRDAFIAARGALRRTLALYLQADPTSIRFDYTNQGKPAINSADNPQDLRFNLSHSAGMALLALTLGCEVGVDIEKVRADFPYLEIAQQFFTAAEYAALRATAPALQAETFFNYWTHKEALIKATGVGLSVPLNQFEVSLAPGVPITSLSTTVQVPAHSILALAPGADYVGACVVLGECSHITLWGS